jgi:type II secretory pathway component PulC
VEGERFAGAVLEDSTGQAFYRINQKLPDGSSIAKVMRDKITLRRPDGVAANIEIVDDTKIVAVPAPRVSGGTGVKNCRTASLPWISRRCSRAPKTWARS